MHLSGLFIYPVKSLRGLPVATAHVDDLGLIGDRRFLVVDETGKFLTQRALPRMAQVSTALSRSNLILSAEGAGSITISTASDPLAPLRVVNVWKSFGLQAEDCGESPACWLSDFLGQKCRLVRAGVKFHRPVLKPAARSDDSFTFADGAPFLIASEASLAELNDRLAAQNEDAVPMNRFRPNFVVAGCAAFAEDNWSCFKLGSVVFRAAGNSARCVMVTTDQLTGERSLEPLRTLARFRRDADDPSDVDFGQNLIHETKRGTVTVGDQIKLL